MLPHFIFWGFISICGMRLLLRLVTTPANKINKGKIKGALKKNKRKKAGDNEYNTRHRIFHGQFKSKKSGKGQKAHCHGRDEFKNIGPECLLTNVFQQKRQTAH